MPFATSGSITMSALINYFSGSAKLSDYYRGGPYIDNVSYNTSVPTSGSISLSQLRGARRKNYVGANLDKNIIAETWTSGGITYSGYDQGAGRGSVFGGSNITMGGVNYNIYRAYRSHRGSGSNYTVTYNVYIIGGPHVAGNFAISFFGRSLPTSYSSDISGFDSFSQSFAPSPPAGGMALSISYLDLVYV